MWALKGSVSSRDPIVHDNRDDEAGYGDDSWSRRRATTTPTSSTSSGLPQETITALIICLTLLSLVTLITILLFIRGCRRRRAHFADLSARIVRESDMDGAGWNNAYGYGLSGGASRPVSPYTVGTSGGRGRSGIPVSPGSSTYWTGSEDQHEEGRESSVYSKRFSASDAELASMTPLPSDMRHSSSNANFTSLADASATLYMLNEEDEGDLGHSKNLHPLSRPNTMEPSPQVEALSSDRGSHDIRLVTESQKGRGRWLV